MSNWFVRFLTGLVFFPILFGVPTVILVLFMKYTIPMLIITFTLVPAFLFAITERPEDLFKR